MTSTTKVKRNLKGDALTIDQSKWMLSQGIVRASDNNGLYVSYFNFLCAQQAFA